MFILTGMNVAQGIFTIFDTSDQTNEGISMAVIADKVRNYGLKVHGIKVVGGVNDMAIPALGLYISVAEAKQELDRYRAKMMKDRVR